MQQQQTALNGEKNLRTLPSLPKVGQKVPLMVEVARGTLRRRKMSFELGIKLKREGKYLGTKEEREDADLWSKVGHALVPLLNKLDELHEKGTCLAQVTVVEETFSNPKIEGKTFFPFRFEGANETFCLCNNNFQGFEDAVTGAPPTVIN